MGYLKWTIAGAVAGLVGAAVWAGIAYFANAEVGFVAWGIGLLVGVAVRVAAGEEEGLGPGVGACSIAIAAVLAGKFGAVWIQVDNAFEDFAQDVSVTDEEMISYMADDIIAEKQAAGEDVESYDEENYNYEDHRSNYTDEIWNAGLTRWNALSPDDQAAAKEEKVAEIKENMQLMQDQLKQQIRGAGFMESFSPYDLLWFGLAAFTAFKVGAGGMDGSES